MTLELLLFFLLAAVAIVAAVGMLLSRNAVYSALFLIVDFADVAVFYLLLGAPFVAMAQVTLYAGAIMVLFLFVIMLLGPEQVSRESVMTWQRPLALALGAILLVETAYLVFRQGVVQFGSPLAASFGDPVALGMTLFNQYLLPFEVTSVLLLVAMIGAIVLTRDN
jgi:NADH-quinone oxidoreductase subunit J